MKGRLSIAILCLILANSPFHAAPAAASTSERVHIRLHMPEIVRKHTHFHKVYKLLPPAMEPTIEHHPYSHSSPTASAPHGKPHVSLLGYTTTASGTGVLSPNLMQLMASAATPMSVLPTLTPNYGPALFDNFNQEVATTTTTTATPATSRPSGSGGNYPGSSSGKSSQQQLLQQIFTPNILAAISASQQQRKKHQQHSYSNNIDMQSEPESESEPELENNEMLNGNFLAALQHEYFNKFGSGTRKRKKIHFMNNYRRPSTKPTSNYVQEGEEHYDDYAEESPTSSTGYEDQPEPTPPSSFGDDEDDDRDEAAGYDSAAAFSGQSNGMSLMPTVDDFLSDVNSNSYAPFYSNMYDDYGPSSVAAGNNNWHSSPPPTFSTYARPTKATPPKLRLRQRRPSSTMSSGKVRYVKLTTRKKRKNRIKSKRYRI
ncbi:uncharacterized protein LOC133838775 [Drosophila sulfurigaster albostrigata]|uniref:uncharacterized protein LOC133838775 n=1 Tax=Drosophila sulfurigaster albostrigata TaxID=89887 RepID=UPI002D21D07B|nr:uncharacterized protein LOC133838775 [Drosophila sulfurigaster albostrigata]